MSIFSLQTKKPQSGFTPTPKFGASSQSERGFTLIELLVVIAIIGLLASVVLVSLNSARTKARDTKRLADMAQMQKALAIYYDQNNSQYPDGDSDGCGTWDVGNKAYPFLNGKLTGIVTKAPVDLSYSDNCSGYRYYRYPAGTNGCDAAKGAFYVMGVTDMETIPGGPGPGIKHPDSPGWSCPGRNWQDEMEWVTGQYER